MTRMIHQQLSNTTLLQSNAWIRRLLLMVLAAVVALVSSMPTYAQDADHPGAPAYDKYCSQCHGDTGKGDGVATPYLKPAPRDLTSGKYKIRRTPTGFLPLDEDLERVIKVGLPYTAMPGFESVLSDSEIRDVVDYIKTFSPDFEDPEAFADPFDIPSAPAYSTETVARGTELYVETGCGRCHGEIGYGDGSSAPTLVDDWGVHIRAADLSMPWTFRGGGTREDIFRTMSAGFNGTPMPGFHGALPPEDIWAIVDYMLSLSGGPPEGGVQEAPYANLLRAVGTEDELDLDRAEELFANAPAAMFPIVGQIVEPGRNFFPQIIAVTAKAIFNTEEIAFMVSWHDMRAETSGTNGPDMPTPLWEEHLAEINYATVPGGNPAGGGEDEGGGDDPWGDEAADESDPWGDEVIEDGGDDPWGDEEVTEDEGDDIWGDEVADSGDESDDDFWGDDDDSGSATEQTLDNEFSDAVAIQFPLTMPEGIRRPYFLFGDTQNPVDLWFLDLAKDQPTSYVGRGSTAMTLSEDGTVFEVRKSYDKGTWTVIFKRERQSRSGISFEEDTFVPLAFSVWDGFNRERGNKRGITSWYDVYIEPLKKPDPLGPMVRAGLGVLGLEILIIALMRRRFGKKATG